MTDTCPNCGRPHNNGIGKLCNSCKAEKKQTQCSNCKGTGTIAVALAPNQKCPVCGGTGYC